MTTANPRLVNNDPVAGFSPQIGRYVTQLAEVRRDLHEQVEGLTVAQLAWHPGEQTESIGTQLLHLDAVELSWMHQDIFGLPDDAYPGDWAEAMPIRVGAPQVSGRPLAQYLRQLGATRAETLRILGDFTDADLPGWSARRSRRPAGNRAVPSIPSTGSSGTSSSTNGACGPDRVAPAPVPRAIVYRPGSNTRRTTSSRISR